MPTLECLTADDLRAVIEGYADALAAHRESINRLNVYPVPDGDTGTNMALTLKSVVDELAGAGPDMDATCTAVAHGSLMGARGNSGVILCQILRGLSAVFKEAGTIDAASVADALDAASSAAYGAVGRPVEGTILTVARVAAESGRVAADSGADLLGVLEAARAGGGEALAETPEMLPVLKEAGVVDAGGTGLLLLLDVALNRVDGRAVPEPDDDLEGASAEFLQAFEAAHGEGGHDGGLAGLRYEVMYFLEAPDESIPGFKDMWATLGDSIVVVGGDGLWNCHIHTDDIGPAVEAGIDVGKPRGIRVTDLLDEFAELEEERWVREAEPMAPEPSIVHEPVPCAVVAVSVGEGVRRIFQSLGVQVVVTGGQTMNPSTAQLLEAVESAPAPHVVILPNNKNIIPVAEQVDAMTSKTVRVVPTRGVAEGFASLLAYDPGAEADTNVDAMAAAASHVVAGEITRAVRDSSTDRGPIREGDWLGIARDGIIAVDDDLSGAATTPARPARGPRARDRHDHRGRGRVAGDHPAPRGVAARQPGRLRGRGPPRRPAAVPVPVRHRVARPDGTAPLAARPAAGHPAEGRRRGQGRRARQARGAVGARPAHLLPAALPRPHQPGPAVRPRGGGGGHGAGEGRAHRVAPHPQRTLARHRRRHRRHRPPPGHLLQPAVPRAAAEGGHRRHPLRPPRAVPGAAQDDQPRRRPHRRPHRAHRARVPAVGEGGGHELGHRPVPRRGAGARAASSPSPSTRASATVSTSSTARWPSTGSTARSRCARPPLPAAAWRSTSCSVCSSSSSAASASSSAPRSASPTTSATAPAATSCRTSTSGSRTTLTGAQRRVIAEIVGDLAKGHPMHRLLQGDVGSGKTVVAVSALLVAVQGGHQGALMAPTEVLAEQHHLGIRALLDGFTVPDGDEGNLFGGAGLDRPLRVVLLTNRTPAGERRRLLADLAEGSVDLVIGTHALISERHRVQVARASSSSTSSTGSASSSGPRCATRGRVRPCPTCSS